jgi:hypothetical protein
VVVMVNPGKEWTFSFAKVREAPAGMGGGWGGSADGNTPPPPPSPVLIGHVSSFSPY